MTSRSPSPSTSRPGAAARAATGWRRPAPALLLSVGFRPQRLRAAHAWRLAAIVALAMRDAAEEQAGLKDGTLWLKWPNDLVAEANDSRCARWRACWARPSQR